MNLRMVVLIGFILFLVCSSMNVGAFSPKSISNDIWVDGVFEGEIKLVGSTGNITGMINLGRSSLDGVFQAEISIDDNFYEAKGHFRENLLFGTFKKKLITLPLIGFLDIHSSSFKVNLVVPSGSIDSVYTASYLPPVSGPFDIGVVEYHLIDESRHEVLTEDPDDKREFMLKVWYPTDSDVEGEFYTYMSEVMFAWLMGRAPIQLPFVSEHAYLDVMPHGRIDVPLATSTGCLPVVLFAHGLDGTIEIYSSFIEELVSRGYVVLSMNHPYIAGVVEFPNGETVYFKDGLWESDEYYFEKAFQTIVDDAKYVLDFVEELNTSGGIFDGKLDVGRIGMYGHSFGGASTSVCCAEDNRIDCGLTLDGVTYEDRLPDGVTKPFFMMTADGKFINYSNVDYIWEKEASDVYKMSILGSTHYGYTDVGLLLSHMLPLIPQNLLNFGTVDSKVMTQIVRLFVVEFFDAYLKDESVGGIIDLAEDFSSYIQFDYK